MFQVIFYHAFRQFARSHAKVASRPKVPSPITLLQVRKTLEQFHRTPALDAPHDLARRQVRRRRRQNMDVTLTHDTFQDFDLKGFARLPCQLPNFQPNVTLQHLIAIFRHKYKMILYLKYRMATVPIILLPPNLMQGKLSQINLTA